MRMKKNWKILRAGLRILREENEMPCNINGTGYVMNASYENCVLTLTSRSSLCSQSPVLISEINEHGEIEQLKGLENCLGANSFAFEAYLGKGQHVRFAKLPDSEPQITHTAPAAGSHLPSSVTYEARMSDLLNHVRLVSNQLVRV